MGTYKVNTILKSQNTPLYPKTNIHIKLNPLFTNSNKYSLKLTRTYTAPFSIASYGGAFVTLGVLHLPEVQSQVRELQGIQVEYTVGRTSLSMKGCFRMPAAGTSPSWLSSPTLPQMDGGNEQPGSPDKRS